MSGYLYILKSERMPDHVLIGTTKRPMEDVLKSEEGVSRCTHLWRVDWPHKLEKAIHEDFAMAKCFDEGNPLEVKEYFKKSVVQRLHLYIDSYLKNERNFSRETERLLQATKEKRPTRQEMTTAERRLDEIERANEASKERRKREGIAGETFADLMSAYKRHPQRK